ncbi:MAG: NUDIX domain-containing protein [Chitinophagaceae bacterium]
MQSLYTGQTGVLLAVDCIIFGFDGGSLKLLAIQRGFEPYKGKWSLLGGFMQPKESIEDAASRILKELTGLEGIYMEQMHVFSIPKRETKTRVVSVAFFALIDIQKYQKQLQLDYHPQWFAINELPRLIVDHDDMVGMAKERLRYKAALHPLLFELLPEKFTIPQLQHLYEEVYDTTFDKGNFSKKILSTRLLVKLKEKDKLSSKKGAFYYKVDKKKYAAGFKSFLNFVNRPRLS